MPPSAITIAMSRFCPPVPSPGVDAAAAVCLCAFSRPHGTPSIALLYVIARIPVLINLAVSTPIFRNLLNLASLAVKFERRVYMTAAFRRTPAPRPNPKALTLL